MPRFTRRLRLPDVPAQIVGGIPVFLVSFFVLKLNPAFPLFFIPPFSGIIFCFRYTLTGDVLCYKMYFEEVRE